MWEAVAAQVLARSASTPLMPSPVQSNPIVSTGNDFSGWTVATSGSSARGGARSDRAPGSDMSAATDEVLGLNTAGPGGSIVASPILLIAAVAALFALRRKGI
ncbi:MAG: hypothetical protein ACOYLX_00885 [Burkholderiaceae bacterium]